MLPAAKLQDAALTCLLHCLCVQVTTFALFRLMRELNGDLTDDQLSNWQQPQAKEGVGNNGSELQEQPELVLVTYVRAGVFGKLCQVGAWAANTGSVQGTGRSSCNMQHPILWVKTRDGSDFFTESRQQGTKLWEESQQLIAGHYLSSGWMYVVADGVCCRRHVKRHQCSNSNAEEL